MLISVNVLTKHLILPAIAPAMIVALYFTPVEIFGCVNRGLTALAVVLVSLFGAVATILVALSKRIQNNPLSIWWLISTLVLILPCVLLFGPLG